MSPRSFFVRSAVRYAGISSAAFNSSIAATDRRSQALNSVSPRSFAKSSVPSEMTTYTSTYSAMRRYSRQHCSNEYPVTPFAASVSWYRRSSRSSFAFRTPASSPPHSR